MRIAKYEKIDLFLFAEYHLDQSYMGGDNALCTKLEQQTWRQFTRLPSTTNLPGKNEQVKQGEKITVFSSLEQRLNRDSHQQLDIVSLPDDPCGEEPSDEARLTLRFLYLPGEPEPLLLAGVHLVSKSHADELNQREEARRIARRIRFAERQVFEDKPPRTIVVGDFNMNPWEEGMTLPDTFRSVDWFDFKKLSPNDLAPPVWSKNYPYFYNPSLALWGDGRTQPGGTYAYEGNTGHSTRRWNLFDQILLRPAALNYWPANFLQGCLRILHKTDLTSEQPLMLTSGSMLEPDSKNYSDHLPILFRLGKLDGSTTSKEAISK